jgi:UDP-glucose 4-epimerase
VSVLVTGGAGYIGSHMVLALLAAGEDVVVLDNLSTGFEWLVPGGATLVKGDMGDRALLDEVIRTHGVDAIAHFAAKIVVPESVAKPLDYYLNNTVKARTVIEAAVENGVKNFIFSSTAAVYGDAEEMPVRETTRAEPVSPYGRSKLMVEWMLADAAHAYGLNSLVLRYFNVAGADPEGRSGQATADATHLIKVAVQAALGLRPGLSVFGTDYPTPDGTCLRDYIHVTDLIQAHMRGLDYLRQGGERITLNCAYGHGSSVKEVIDVVKTVSGVDFPVTLADRRPGDPAAIVAEGQAVRSVLGWRPEFDDLEQIVAHALAWEKHLMARNA